MTQTPSTVVFVSLTGDEEIKVYDLDPSSGALRLRTTNPAHGPSGALFYTQRSTSSTTRTSSRRRWPAFASTRQRGRSRCSTA